MRSSTTVKPAARVRTPGLVDVVLNPIFRNKAAEGPGVANAGRRPRENDRHRPEVAAVGVCDGRIPNHDSAAKCDSLAAFVGSERGLKGRRNEARGVDLFPGVQAQRFKLLLDNLRRAQVLLRILDRLK